MDRGVEENQRAPGMTLIQREPDHLLVHSDQKRPTVEQRGIAVGPVRRAVADGVWLGHTSVEIAWIQIVNT